MTPAARTVPPAPGGKQGRGGSGVRWAPFALRVVQRRGGLSGILYRRRSDTEGRDRLQRVAALSPLAFTAATPLLRQALRHSSPSGRAGDLAPGPFHPLDADWGARAACFALLASGLRDPQRLLRAAQHLRQADATEAAWWLGLLTRDDSPRALRALRILTEAVE